VEKKVWSLWLPTGIAVAVGVAIPVLLIAGIIYFIYDYASQPAVVSDEDVSTAALVECEDYVKNQLTSPATADFAPQPEQTQRNGNTFRIVSYVDSENGFGAKLRSNYDCVIQWNGQKIDHAPNWTLLSLILK
jgi:hypothetical protein